MRRKCGVNWNKQVSSELYSIIIYSIGIIWYYQKYIARGTKLFLWNEKLTQQIFTSLKSTIEKENIRKRFKNIKS